LARFLLVPHAPGGTLAHLAACISVAEALREDGHQPVLAYGGTRPELLEQAGLRWLRVAEAGGAMAVDWFDSDEQLDRILASQLEAIERVGPDVCITSAGAGRLAVAVAGAPHLALMHGLGNSPFGRRGRRRQAILGDLRRPRRALEDLRIELRPRGRHTSARIWNWGWVRHTGAALDRETVATGRADAVACTTTPMLDPAPGMPVHWSYIGPLSFAPAAAGAPAPRRPDRPRVYVSQGSTGAPELLRRSVAELAGAGFAVIASAGGLCDPRELEQLGDDVEAAELHDARAELEAADVAVISGGHMTAMEALIAGTPTVVVPRTAGQALAAKRAERLGTGIGLWPRVPRGGVARAARRLCADEGYRMRAATVTEHLRGWSGRRNAAALAEELAGASRAAARP
jgi:UDP:flavonoid glycosyltransferase YjiC (YdhE family)